MTLSRFFWVFFLQLIIFTALKVFFYSNLPYENVYWQFLFWCATVVVSVALVRRLGVINFLEGAFVGAFWFVSDLILDLFVTWPLSGVSIFTTASLWGGYLVMMVFVFFFHKKRHIHIRKQQRAHHGHH